MDRNPRLTRHTTSQQQRAVLTPREREVLDLLVARYTDREIAEALFVSYRTVTTHVASIRRKLGASNRRDAAAVATRGGLV
jgi:DNA-binding CsgD family transcriptional regulator